MVYLQHKVRELEVELHQVENEEYGDDPETMTHAANVRVHEATDSKYLGPSSGIAITRLVMQLAKQFTDAKSIKDIVPDQRARHIKDLYDQEQAKPTSKIYPLISDVAAVDLPNRTLTDLLLQLYKLKVQPMYPALHEPSLDIDVDAVYLTPDEATPYQNFVCRMVIAISLQKMDTQYAGLADSYYLAALKHLEPVVRPMDLKTLQCFALMAEYSLLTPTRTAIYYVVGIAVRLAQALGLNEEKTITRGRADGTIDFLEIDMRRRLFWCVVVMDFGLAHSLGRPAILATHQDHIDVGWFESCDDEFITPDGINPSAPRPVLKKWVAIHFFKMRLLQLEIRRKLYQRKRPEPKDDTHPWFIRMDAKLTAWRDAAPSQGEGFGLDKGWFVARFNTMVVFLYRPSPQVPRPSVNAALKCFDACESNIHLQRDQIMKKNVDLTWVFTQQLFMAINTMLWSLSYAEVRRLHKRDAVEQLLTEAMDATQLASERWPGVASAVQLYENLITAILRVYEKNEDIPISAATPSDAASPGSTYADAHNRSRTTSPASVSTHSIATPPENKVPYIHGHQQSRSNVEQHLPSMSYPTEFQRASLSTSPNQPKPFNIQNTSPDSRPSTQGLRLQQQQQQQQSQAQSQPQSQPFFYDPNHQFNALPQFIPNLTVPSWSMPQKGPITNAYAPSVPAQSMYGFSNLGFDANNATYPWPAASSLDDSGNTPSYAPQQFWDMDSGVFGSGLNQDQQEELMHSLETDGMEDIQSLISTTLASLTPQSSHPSSF